MTSTVSDLGRPLAATQLLAAWELARSKGLNNRAAAEMLKVSEAQLIASGCGRFVTRLHSEAPSVLRKLPLLGEIKAVVRNPAAVIERAGTVQDVAATGGGEMLIRAEHFEVAGKAAQWEKGFALREEAARGFKLSLQFFTADGTSAAKFFLRPASDVHAFADLVAAFASSDQSEQESVALTCAKLSLPLQASAPVAAGALLGFLQAAARLAHPLTFVTRNAAASLSTSKAIERIKLSDRGEWVNVLDDGMDIHLHQPAIRYVRPVADPAGQGGWLHWLSEGQAVALSTRCGEGWAELLASTATAALAEK